MRHCLLPLAGVLLIARAWTAPMTDDKAPDAAALDAQVEVLAKARAEGKAAFFLRVRNELEAPIRLQGAAGNYIIECIRRVQYEGHQGANADFAEWKKKNRDLFSNHDFEKAADLHLRYLALTLKRATLDSPESLMPELWSYLDLLSKSQDLLVNVLRDPEQTKIRVYDPKKQEFSGEIVGQLENTRLASAANARSYVQDLLNGSVSAGLAAQALKVNELLDGIEGWEMAPGNFSGILEQDVRKFMRDKKDPQLLATWDYEILYLSSLAKLKRDENALTEFEKKDYPRLLWKKTRDAELLGFPNKALNMKISVARKYPQHPDFEQWTSEISAELAARRKALATTPSTRASLPPAAENP